MGVEAIQHPGGEATGAPLSGRTVLQIIPTLDAGGAERTAIDIAGALAEAGARALVASQGGRLVSELQARGGLWIPFPAGAKNPLTMVMNIARLRRLIRNEGVDLVHARSRAPAWSAFAASRATKTPFVTTYHGIYNGRSALKIHYNSIMARGDAVIANSQFTADRISRLHGVGGQRVEVIHRGTDFRQFAIGAVDPARVSALRQAWGVEIDERIVLLSARLTAWKGQSVLIEAARILQRQGLTGVRFILAGDAQGRTGYVEKLDGLIADYRLADIVKRVGHCEDMPAAYLASALVTVPSTEPEAFGRVAVEAQAMGTPVIVSDLGAANETVLAPPRVPEEARTGWSVQAGDPHALADAIAQALAMGAARRDHLAVRARAHVLERFSLDAMIDRTLALYGRLLQGQRFTIQRV